MEVKLIVSVLALNSRSVCEVNRTSQTNGNSKSQTKSMGSSMGSQITDMFRVSPRIVTFQTVGSGEWSSSLGGSPKYHATGRQ